MYFVRSVGRRLTSNPLTLWFVWLITVILKLWLRSKQNTKPLGEILQGDCD
jgi:hypothetical protein